MNWENVKWRTSSRSGSGSNCVEVAVTTESVGIRDSKNRQGPQLEFDAARFAAFVVGLKGGDLR